MKTDERSYELGGPVIILFREVEIAEVGMAELPSHYRMISAVIMYWITCGSIDRRRES